jgi:hypothetical protein
MPEFMHWPQGLFRPLSRIVWIVFVAALLYGFYNTWYLPHGRSFPTGREICPEVGPCGVDEMREDLSGLNIPALAKIFREYEEAIILLLLVLGIFLTESARREEDFLKRNPAYRLTADFWSKLSE